MRMTIFPEKNRLTSEQIHFFVYEGGILANRKLKKIARLHFFN